MKKFTNNSLWGMIVMGLNLVILIMVIISAVKLGSYDSKNMHLQDSVMPKYTFWADSVANLQDALGKKQNSLDGYTKLCKETEASAQKFKELLASDPENKEYGNKYYSDTTHLRDYKENITRLEGELKGISDTLQLAQQDLKPWAAQREKGLEEVAPDLRGYNAILIIAAILMLCKVLSFGFWMNKNYNNTRHFAPWQTKTDRIMTILGWLIPIYNLFKPCSMFSNMISETKYALLDKSIITDAKDSNQMESIGFWWGSYLMAKVVMPFFIGGLAICLNFWLLPLLGTDIDTAQNTLGMLSFGTYFGNTGLFYYLRPHTIVMVAFLLCWLVYVGYECYMIYSYNKLNKMLCDNESKFETELSKPETAPEK
ncbi:MAG: DUF4328 domain-containing protein [Bacteroidales bacterium]|nr:DUF4328 domain-containing protein [Bacteroidales bacterium]